MNHPVQTRPSTADQMQEVLKNIQEQMALKSVTKAAMAKAIGIAPSTLARKLQGSTDFTVPQIARIAFALNICPSDLFPHTTAEGK